jgi:DNA repair photolyase
MRKKKRHAQRRGKNAQDSNSPKQPPGGKAEQEQFEQNAAQPPGVSGNLANQEDFETLRIEEAGKVARKPRFFIHSNSVINTQSEFKEKLLCDGLTFTAGHACAFSCGFCYVESMLKKNKRLNVILAKTKCNFEDVAVEIADAPRVARESLLSRGKARFADPEDKRVIFASPLVDVAATMAHVRVTVEICRAILELTHWQIRLLSKSSLLLHVAKAIPTEFKNRMIYGFSTGTLDSSLARIYEVGTALVSKRLDALHWLQDNGYRTFGMVCPVLPQKDYDQFAVEVAAKIRVGQCEHVWAEALNQRCDSLRATSLALRKAGRVDEADRVDAVAADRSAWEDYARKAFLALGKMVPPEKFRFLQYVTKDTRSWWEQQAAQGAVLLGRSATEDEKPVALVEPLNGPERKKLRQLEKIVADDMCRFIKVGLALAEIRDLRLYRETHPNFEAYCRDKFDMARAYAYRLISQASVVTDLSPIGNIPKPQNEAQARELAKAPKERRVEVMKLVAAKVGDGPLTAKAIQVAVHALNGASVANGNGAGKHVNGKQGFVTVELPVFLEWVQALKELARIGQQGDLLRLLNKAEVEQTITLEAQSPVPLENN